MAEQSAGTSLRRAPDGSPYPKRGSAGFEREVRAMFTHIVERYDWFDHVASLGNDYLWRPRALWDLTRWRKGVPVRFALDVGCGTGDLSLTTARQFPGARVLASDFTSAMLVKAARRPAVRALGGQIRFARANGMGLPFRDGSFDLVMSAFVARNLPDLRAGLLEFRRVLNSTGTLLTLEITEPVSPWVRSLFHAYFDNVVPWMGAMVGSAGPYRYLPESLRDLPSREEFVWLLKSVGFEEVATRTQSGGIVTSFFAGGAGSARAKS